MGTQYYDFTYLNPTDNIDLVGDTTRFLDEIDAEIKSVDDASMAANAAVAALGSRVAQPWYLIMGDSWADTGRTDTYSQWAKDAKTRYSRCKSYAVSGAKGSDLPSQISRAVSDSAFNNSQVTKIVVIVGVNDFNTGVAAGTLAGQLNTFNSSVKANFPNAECVIFCDCPNPTCYVSTTYAKSFDGNMQYCMDVKNSMIYGNYVWLGHFLPSNAFYDFSQLSTGVYHTYHMSPLGNVVMGQLFEAFINGAPLETSGRVIEAGINDVYMAKVNPQASGAKTIVDTFNAFTRYNTVVRGNANKDESALYTIHSGAHETVQNSYEYVVIVPLNKINLFNGTFGMARNYRAEVETNRGLITPATSTGSVVNYLKQYPLPSGYYFTNANNGVVNLRGTDYVIVGSGVMYYNGANAITEMTFTGWEQYATDSSFR